MQLLENKKRAIIIIKRNQIEIFVNKVNINDMDYITQQVTLRMLSNDENIYVRMRVAKHNNTPIEVLAKLATDKSFSVRYAVASNKRTPVEILRILKNDDDEAVRLAADRLCAA